MTDIPPNSPIDIRALALYDIHQWKTTDKSYKNYEKLCEVLGKEAISYDEYESLFNKFLEENYYSTKDGRGLPIPDIRGCILSDVINGKIAEKSIDDLSEAFKKQKVDTEDHGYWYKRFRSGHFSQVTFSDFPEDVIAEIVEKCDIKSYLNLRNVSYGLRTVVDQLVPPCTDIKVTCRNERVHVHIYDARIADSKCFDILKLLLKNPKLLLKCFYFIANSYFRVTEILPGNHKQDFFDFLNSLDHKIHVEKCVMWGEYEKDLIGVLKCLKSGTLEKLDIDSGFSMDEINEVVSMNQWNLAKHLKIITSELPSIENFFHFSTFELGIGKESIALEDMVKLCEGKMSKTPALSIYESTFAQSDKTDVILIVEGKKLRVSKTVLSFHSDYFDALFNADFMEISMPEISIEDVNFEDFAAVLSLILKNPISPTEENAEKLLELSDRFLLPAAKRHVEFFLISVGFGAYKKLELASRYDSDTLLTHALELFKTKEELVPKEEFSGFSEKVKAKILDRLIELNKPKLSVPTGLGSGLGLVGRLNPSVRSWDFSSEDSW